MSFDAKRFVDAIQEGDLPAVKETISAYPQSLTELLKWRDGQNNGFAIHAAAFFNQPQIIQFLVEEIGMDVNHQKGVAALFSPLHHACVLSSEAAVSMLLQLGARPRLLNERKELAASFTKSQKIKDMISAAGEGRVVVPTKREGDVTWRLPSAYEVVSSRQLLGVGISLTDIFNFKTRRVITLSKEASGAMAQSIHFFDDMQDKSMLVEAHAKYASLGGKIEPSVIDNRILKKIGK